MKKKSAIYKTLHWFNATGLIHTLISVAIFVLSLFNYLKGQKVFYYSIEILASITLFNSLIWILCAIVLLLTAKKLNNPVSVKNTRKILAISIILVLTPDILMELLFFLPMLSESKLINLIGFLSPVLVFIGWFVGKHLGKKIEKRQ